MMPMDDDTYTELQIISSSSMFDKKSYLQYLQSYVLDGHRFWMNDSSSPSKSFVVESLLPQKRGKMIWLTRKGNKN